MFKLFILIVKLIPKIAGNIELKLKYYENEYCKLFLRNFFFVNVHKLRTE